MKKIMVDYFVKKTYNTPEIHFIPSEGLINMEGRAIPENPDGFFKDLIIHLNKYYTEPQSLTKIDIKLEYVNSGSAKYLMDIFRIVKRNYEKGHNCLVTWYFEDDDESIQDLGLHYKNAFNIPFKVTAYF